MLIVFIVVLNYGWRDRIDRFSALPPESGIVVDWPELSSLETWFNHWDTQINWRSLPLIQQMEADLDQIAASCFSDTLLWQRFRQQPGLAAWQWQSAEDQHFFYVFEANDDLLNAFFQQLATEALTRTSFRNLDLYQLQLLDGRHLTACRYQHLLLLAPLPLLIEDAIKQLQGREVQSSPSRQLDRPGIYLQFSALPNNLNPLIKRQWRPLLQQFSSLGTWWGVQPGEQRDELLGFFTSQTTQPMGDTLIFKQWHERLGQLLPDNTAMYYTAAVPPELPFQLEGCAGPWSSVWVEAVGKPVEEQQFVLLDIADEVKLRNSLEAYALERGELASVDYQSFRIGQLLDGQLLDPFPGTYTAPYYCFLDQALLFANDRQALELWLDRYIAGGQLGQQATLANRIVQNHSSAFYFDQQLLTEAMLQLSAPERAQNLRGTWQAFGPLQGLMAMHGKGETTAFRLWLQSTNQPVNPLALSWKTQLAAPILGTPQFVLDNRQQLDRVFVQDEQFKLYCYSPKGKLLWQRQLETPILSSISPLYQDGKSWLFNTKNRIYRLMPSGKDIPGYPKHLLSPATNGLVQLSFTDQPEPLYLLGCENGNAYAWYADGVPVNGWNPQEGVGRLGQPIQKLAIAEQDVLLLQNEDGQLQLRNRQGMLQQAVGEKTLRAIIQKVEDEVLLWYLTAMGDSYCITSGGQVKSSMLLDLQTPLKAAHYYIDEQNQLWLAILDHASGLHYFREQAGELKPLNHLVLDSSAAQLSPLLLTTQRQPLVATFDKTRMRSSIWGKILLAEMAASAMPALQLDVSQRIVWVAVPLSDEMYFYQLSLR